MLECNELDVFRFAFSWLKTEKWPTKKHSFLCCSSFSWSPLSFFSYQSLLKIRVPGQSVELALLVMHMNSKSTHGLHHQKRPWTCARRLFLSGIWASRGLASEEAEYTWALACRRQVTRQEWFETFWKKNCLFFFVFQVNSTPRHLN